MGKQGAKLYDRFMASISASRFQKIREKVIAQSKGEVLEIGSGTGINFPLYRSESVGVVHAIEPNRHHLKRSKIKQAEAKATIHLYEEKAENLPFSDAQFDTIICMLVFCTIPDPIQAINEVIRVAKPGATVLFLEHVKVERPFIKLTQNMLNPVWKLLAGGCHLNRDTRKLIEQSPLEIVDSHTYYKDVLQYVKCVKR